MHYKKLLFLILPVAIVCSLFSNIVAGQDLPGKRDSLQSAILKEKRIIQVVLPDKYKPGSTDKYDVLYVLDGDWNTKIMTEVEHFIEGEAYMPPTIIVGVLNTDRDRDFLPTHVDGNDGTSGGAAQFLSFLKKELIPYVNKAYPSNGNNTLFGHSFGGVFVTYALLNEPQVFDSYIAADPSYWWDKGVMYKQVKDKLPALASLNKTLYITGREGRGMIEMGIPTMDSILKKNAPGSLVWKVMAYPDETHGSVRLKSMYDGLKFTYAGYSLKPIQFHPMTGIVLKDKPFKVWYLDDPTKIRYTTDGTEPVLTSAQMLSEITLTAPGKLTAKLFAKRPKYDKVTVGDFTEGTVWPAEAKAKNFKPGGFNYKYYEGEWDKLPDFKTLKPVKSGITDTSFNINKLPRKDNFALLIEGKIEIKEDGYYILALISDDGSKLYLDNKLLIDYDGLHGNDGGKSYIVPLQKGFYPVRVEYFQKDGNRDLRLICITPSIKTLEPVPVPFEQQYNSK